MAITPQDPLKNAQDFESQFMAWYASGLKGKIDDSRRRERMILKDAKDRTDRKLSALPSTKSTEVIDKAKDAALVEYHKDAKAISYTATSTQDTERNKMAQWLTAIVHYRMSAIGGFPFITWHESSLKAGYTDGMEAAMVYWDKQAWEDKKTVYKDNLAGTEVTADQYKQIKANWGLMQVSDPSLPAFEVMFSKESVTEEVVCKDTWWIRQLLPGENVFWDFKAPFMNVNAGQACLVKLSMTVDEIMALMDKGVFDKMKREEIEQHQTLQGTTAQGADRTAIATTKNSELSQCNPVEVWIFWEKINFRWMVSFSIEGKKELTKDRKPSDDIFFNGRRVNMLPVVIGYMDKYLHENMGRSLPQVIAPIEDQYIDHINNVNDIAKNIARGGRIRITPGTDVNLDQVMNGAAFTAEEGDVEFTQYNPGVMEGMRASDMHSAAINALAPVGVSSVNLAPKGTNKTLGQSQMVQGASDSKRYVQLMVRNQTFFKPLMWLIAQLEFAYETDEKILKIAAANVPGFQLPMTVSPTTGKPMVDVSVLDFDINTRINAGLGEMPDIEKMNNLVQAATLCKQIGIILDPMVLAELGMSLSGYSLDRFNPQPPPSNIPPPKLDSKLTVTAGWLDLPDEVKRMLVDKWAKGQVATDTKIDAQMNEMMHNKGSQPGAQPAPDMTQGEAAMGMSRGGMQ
jgi:hypothetical protein